MAELREHHFVPQFYLKNFSSDRKQILLLNLSRDIFVKGASIRHQCSRRNFYGTTSDTENLLSGIEGKAASLIQRILKSERPPLKGSADHYILAAFATTQQMRTPPAASVNGFMTESIADLATEGGGDPKQFINDNLKDPFPTALPLSLSHTMIPAALSLEVHLFLNKSGIDFITSDVPLVTHNFYCEGINYKGVRGWESPGFQVLLPLSPRQLIMLYDERVYKCGGKSDKTTIIDNIEEINNLNSFQILNCNNNIYFYRENSLSILRQQSRSLAPKRPIERMISVRAKSDEDNMNEIIHWYEPLIPHQLRLSSIRFKRRMRPIPLHKRPQMFVTSPIRRQKDTIRFSVRGNDSVKTHR